MQIATDAVASWCATRPGITGEFQRDADTHSKFWRQGGDLLASLSEKPERNHEQARAAEAILRTGRESREAFMGRHAEAVYRALTKGMTTFVRADELVYEAAKLVPGLVPARSQVATEAEKLQSDKDGIEVDQGIFFAHILARPEPGMHFCHAMLLPKEESGARMPELAAKGVIDFGTAAIARRGKASYVFLKDPRFLNAEDDAT